jgi:hypothetical protein
MVEEKDCEPMTDPDEIREQMRRIRRGIGADVQGAVQSAQELKQLTDWRYYVRKHPWLCVGSAFAIGFLAAPKRSKLGRQELDKLLAQVREANLGALGVTPSMTRSLMMKALGIAGPIAARAAANFIASHLAPTPPPPAAADEPDDEPRDPSFEQVSKPR